MDYSTTLSENTAATSVLVFTIIAWTVAFCVSRRMKSVKWMPHVVFVVYVICSPLIAASLGDPMTLADEQPGPGNGFAYLPVIGEAAVFVFIYCVLFVTAMGKWLLDLLLPDRPAGVAP